MSTVISGSGQLQIFKGRGVEAVSLKDLQTGEKFIWDLTTTDNISLHERVVAQKTKDFVAMGTEDTWDGKIAVMRHERSDLTVGTFYRYKEPQFVDSKKMPAAEELQKELAGLGNNA